MPKPTDRPKDHSRREMSPGVAVRALRAVVVYAVAALPFAWSEMPLWKLVGALSLLAAVVGGLAVYLAVYEGRVLTRHRDLSMVSVPYLGAVYALEAAWWAGADPAVYLAPAVVAAILCTLLLDARIAILVTACVGATAAILARLDPPWVAAIVLAGFAATASMARMRRRRHVAQAALLVACGGGLLSMAAALASGADPQGALLSLGWGLGAGLLAALVSYGLLPVFERLFHVVTDVRLLELADPAAPLLRELMVRAPGTYSHSLTTANLAEAGAEAIHANALLARVGAYYHDVGKIRRPEFFVENQGGRVNPHEESAPRMSAMIITAHVREGADMASEHNLPDEVVRIVRDHHGDSLVSYFYSKALDREDEAVFEGDYRYRGSRPSSREAALVMIADSIEAAARCIGKPTPERIESMVRKVIDSKLDDHQLDDSHLTMADLETLVEVYSRMLSGIHHPRVEYPDADVARRTEDAGECNQSS